MRSTLLASSRLPLKRGFRPSAPNPKSAPLAASPEPEPNVDSTATAFRPLRVAPPPARARTWAELNFAPCSALEPIVSPYFPLAPPPDPPRPSPGLASLGPHPWPAPPTMRGSREGASRSRSELRTGESCPQRAGGGSGVGRAGPSRAVGRVGAGPGRRTAGWAAP